MSIEEMCFNTNFKKRCEEFWCWFSENEKTLADFCENRDKYTSEEIVELMRDGLSLVGNVAFNIGGDYELTFAIDGVPTNFYINTYLVSKMPSEYMGKWTIRSYMEPSDVGINMYGKSFSGENIFIKAELLENKLFDIKFYNEDLLNLSEDECWGIFFNLFDVTLGEKISMNHIADIGIADGKTEDMIKLLELKDYIIETLKRNEISFTKEYVQTFSGYGFEPTEREELRYDVATGATANSRLVNDYYAGEYDTFEHFSNFGIKAGFLFVQNEGNELKNHLELRYFLKDALNEEVFGYKENKEYLFAGNEQGLVLGGATGIYKNYIDVLVFDDALFFEKCTNFAKKHNFKIYYSDFIKNSPILELF